MHPRRQQLLLVVAMASAMACGLAACNKVAAEGKPAPVASLDVRELNIVDEHGNVRLRLAAPLPGSPPQGGVRRNALSGIQFLDPAAGEVGGIVMIDKVGVHGFCWDYGNSPAEAVCFSLIKGQPRISINDTENERIGIGLTNGVAQVVLAGSDGKPKLRLEVDKQGRARVEGTAPTR